MADAAINADHFQFTSLSLENVRAFGGQQVLSLVDGQDRPAKWNLILGENGVGKTTIMQALARMCPIPAFSRNASPQDVGTDAGTPKWVEPELSTHENVEIHRFVRFAAATVTTKIDAVLQSDTGEDIKIGVICESDAEKLQSVDFTQFPHELAAEGPLVVGYGAARHVGHGNSAVVEDRDPTSPLFSDAIDLFDAEEILGLMHYAALSSGGKRDARRLGALKAAVADLIPDMSSADIEVRGPRVPGRPEAESGVHVRTPSGTVPLIELSLGYQTVFAWTVDLAWRLFRAYPRSPRPLREGAIVLIDEVDLHLHPRWQRSLRHHLTRTLPRHAVHRHHAQPGHCAGDPFGRRQRRRGTLGGRPCRDSQQPLAAERMAVRPVLTSELFGFDSSRGPVAEAQMNERLALLRKGKLTAGERRRLAKLDAFAADLPTARTPNEQTFEDLMRKVAQYQGADAKAR